MSDDAERALRAEERRRTWISRIYRNGHSELRPPDASKLSSGERMALVWELLLECLAYKGFSADELRLQRSVGRVERRGG